MKRTEAVEVLREFWDRPVFNVKIGMCSPQIRDVDFESALIELDRCARFTTEFIEYVFIYVSDFVNAEDREKLEKALFLFNLGSSRHRLNQNNFWT
jgi:hypothetical protein